MLGVGGLSFSLGMGSSEVMVGLTENAGSKNDSLNFSFTLAPLGPEQDDGLKTQTSRTRDPGPELHRDLMISLAVFSMVMSSSGILFSSTSEAMKVSRSPLSTLMRRIFSSLGGPSDSALSFRKSVGPMDEPDSGSLRSSEARSSELLEVHSPCSPSLAELAPDTASLHLAEDDDEDEEDNDDKVQKVSSLFSRCFFFSFRSSCFLLPWPCFSFVFSCLWRSFALTWPSGASGASRPSAPAGDCRPGVSSQLLPSSARDDSEMVVSRCSSFTTGGGLKVETSALMAFILSSAASSTFGCVCSSRGGGADLRDGNAGLSGGWVESDVGELPCCWRQISGPSDSEEEYLTPSRAEGGGLPKGPPRYAYFWLSRTVARDLKVLLTPVWWRCGRRGGGEHDGASSSSSSSSSSTSLLLVLPTPASIGRRGFGGTTGDGLKQSSSSSLSEDVRLHGDAREPWRLSTGGLACGSEPKSSRLGGCFVAGMRSGALR
ncbi:hypothetical protein EYF80_039289 [Liparis tanakae]|uniref:Uncharacterized protein n=1 Tax=Liparis tanakae TaxID=230148 RepID=A0A4Z2GAR6_9TELE|nr:hypothetical protein EYF80_039289 [Liparis tanakae]